MNKKNLHIAYLYMVLWIGCTSKNTRCPENHVYIQKSCLAVCENSLDTICPENFYCHTQGYCSPGKNRAPMVLSLDGNGSSSASSSSENLSSFFYIKNGFFITGKNLHHVTKILLINPHNTEDFQTLAFNNVSETSLEALLPETFNIGTNTSYQLSFESLYGTETAFVDLQRGIRGPVGDAGENGQNYEGIQGPRGSDGSNAVCLERDCLGKGFPGAQKTVTVKIHTSLQDNSGLTLFSDGQDPIANSITTANSITLAQYNLLNNTLESLSTHTLSNMDDFFNKTNNITSNTVVIVFSQGDTSHLVRAKNADGFSVANILMKHGAGGLLQTLQHDQTFAFVGGLNKHPASASTYVWDNTASANKRSAIVLIADNHIWSSHTKTEQKTNIAHIRGPSITQPHCTPENIMFIGNTLSNTLKWDCATQNLVTSSHLQSNSITTRHWADAQINANHIQNNAVVSAHIQSNTLNSTSLSNGAIVAHLITHNAVIGNTIANNALLFNSLENNAVLGVHLSNNALEERHFGNNSILPQHFQNAVLYASHFDTGSITQEKIQQNSIHASHIQNNTFGKRTLGGPLRLQTSTQGISITPLDHEENAYILSNTWIFKNTDNTDKNVLLNINNHFLTMDGPIRCTDIQTNTFHNAEILRESIQNNAVLQRHLTSNAFLPAGICVLSTTSCPSGWTAKTSNTAAPIAHTTTSSFINNLRTFSFEGKYTLANAPTHTHAFLNNTDSTHTQRVSLTSYTSTGSVQSFLSEASDESTSHSATQQPDDFAGHTDDWTTAYTSHNEQHSHTIASNTSYKVPTAAFIVCCKNTP
jgi:hypothetical protein